jgi:hypothetical protein
VLLNQGWHVRWERDAVTKLGQVEILIAAALAHKPRRKLDVVALAIDAVLNVVTGSASAFEFDNCVAYRDPITAGTATAGAFGF